MNPQIAAMIDGIIGREGAYVDHPSDPGGATIWGMTERVARANGYTDDMRVMPQAVARDIYYREYIVKPGFLSIAEIDPAVAEEVIDSGVNAGQKRAALWFQQALNVLNRRGVDFGDITEDGIIGRGSIAAFQALLLNRGDSCARRLMLKALNGLQFMHYYGLAKGGTKFEDFMPGWIDGRIGVLG